MDIDYEKLTPSDVYFCDLGPHHDNDGSEYDSTLFALCPKAYWHSTGAWDDWCVPDEIEHLLPRVFHDVGGGVVGYCGTPESGRKKLLKAGFIENNQLKDAPLDVSKVIPESEIIDNAEEKAPGGKITTADCIQHIIDKFGQDIISQYDEMIEEAEGDDEGSKYYKKMRASVTNPKKWTRATKLKLGSTTDLEGTDKILFSGHRFIDFYRHLRGCTARIFILKDSGQEQEYIYFIVEKDGKIVVADDFS